MHDDDRIISLLNQRDESALQIIRERYGAMCFQIAYRMTGNREDAEECVSDMLLDVWNSIPPNCPDHLPAYLASLVRRTAIDKYEKAHRRKRGGTQFCAALDELAEIIPSGEQVEHQVEQRELTAALTKWLQALPERKRNIFLLRYFMSESVQTIAQKYGMSLSAVKMELLRTREKLKEYLRKEGLL